jgi:hypothetical protein
MVVDYLHLLGALRRPNKADPELIVDSDTVLPTAIALECFQAISGRRCQISKFLCAVELNKLSCCHLHDAVESAGSALLE